MKLDGIGSSHNTDTHQVTNCMHDHAHYKKESGAAAASSVVSSEAFRMQQQQQEAEFSLSAWLQKTLGDGKNFLRGIWGANAADSSAQAGNKAGQEQMMAQLGDNVTSNDRGTAAKSQELQINPYFQAMQDNSPDARMTPFQRVRYKVKGVAGQLAGKLPGHFFRFRAKNSFQAKPEQRPKEDLRKRSKYRKDELEIDCILTDESYLMDSYDRKGEYSRLTTKK